MAACPARHPVHRQEGPAQGEKPGHQPDVREVQLPRHRRSAQCVRSGHFAARDQRHGRRHDHLVPRHHVLAEQQDARGDDRHYVADHGAVGGLSAAAQVGRRVPGLW